MAYIRGRLIVGGHMVFIYAYKDLKIYYYINKISISIIDKKDLFLSKNHLDLYLPLSPLLLSIDCNKSSNKGKSQFGVQPFDCDCGFNIG